MNSNKSEGKGSTIPEAEGPEGGEGSEAVGPTIVAVSEEKESLAAEGSAIVEGSGETGGSVAVDLEGYREGVGLSARNGG